MLWRCSNNHPIETNEGTHLFPQHRVKTITGGGSTFACLINFPQELQLPPVLPQLDKTHNDTREPDER